MCIRCSRDLEHVSCSAACVICPGCSLPAVCFQDVHAVSRASGSSDRGKVLMCCFCASVLEDTRRRNLAAALPSLPATAVVAGLTGATTQLRQVGTQAGRLPTLITQSGRCSKTLAC